MGHFSMEKPPNPGSVLGGNQHQGVLAKRLLPRFGEIRVARAGLFVNVIGLAALAGAGFLPTVPPLFVAVIVFTLGDGLFQPSSSALIANTAPPYVQGRIQGANQAQQSIARMVGPLLAAAFAGFHPSAPYGAGAIIVAAAVVAMMRRAPEAAS